MWDAGTQWVHVAVGVGSWMVVVCIAAVDVDEADRPNCPRVRVHRCQQVYRCHRHISKASLVGNER